MEHNTTLPYSKPYSKPYPKGFLRWVLLFPVHVYRFGFGEILNLFNIMILGVRGRSSGLPRYVPVEFRRHGSKLYVVSGWGEHPQWFRNLLVQPLATVQIGTHMLRARAHPVTDRSEASRVLTLFHRHATALNMPVFARLNTGILDPQVLPDISDQFTIMRLDIEEGALPVAPVRRDLAWLLPGTMLMGVTLLSLRIMRHRI